MTNTEAGCRAELAVMQWLRSEGIKVKRAAYYAPFDLFTSVGSRIEVKYSKPQWISNGKYRMLGWRFNLHRHGERKAGSEVDVYIFYLSMDHASLKQLGCDASVYLIIPAKDVDGVLTAAVSVRSMMTRYAKYFNNFQAITDSDGTKTPNDLRETQIRALIPSSQVASAHYEMDAK